MRFKDNLRKQRTKNNLSQERLAEKMSVSRQTVSKWENGDTYPSMGHILMLTDILNCSMDDFVDNKSDSVVGRPIMGKQQLNKTINWIVGVVTILFVTTLVFAFPILISHMNEKSIIDSSKIAVFDKMIDGSLDDTIATDGYIKKRIVGYGITEPDKTFYIKCDLYNNESNVPCSAIIYFCEYDDGYSYKCQYLDDPGYIPEGKYYEIG